MHKKRLAMTTGSLFDVETTSQINFWLNPSIHPCTVFIGPDDSYTFRLMTLCFPLSTFTGSNIKRAFLASCFAMLVPYLREINLAICL